MQRQRAHTQPRHLSRSETGRWSFAQRVPVELQVVLGRRLMKQALRTREPSTASVCAVVLGRRPCSALRTIEGSTRGQAQQSGC
ncbi:DUF6538 domain-containing protein [Stenotrophomonas sp. HMSC10F06]|uniref:DUF6538 domain-containing protein n=1 Tax=Stenotrophomonas sp. HMSC10F06 TaxID=1581081 RepID=UPI0031B63A9C